MNCRKGLRVDERTKDRALEARKRLRRWLVAWVVLAVATMSVGAASVLPDLSASLTFGQMIPSLCLAAAAAVAAVNAGRAWVALARIEMRAPGDR